MAKQSAPIQHDVAAMTDAGWRVVQAAARAAERLAQAHQRAVFALGGDGELRPVPAGDPDALIAWHPGAGWEAVVPDGDSRRAFIDLYLPICSATVARP